jgi:phenylalanyl-tRNA synthetase alpha subunit
MPAEPAPSRIQTSDQLTAALRTTWRITILGLILMVGLISYAAFEYLHLQRQVATKRQELQKLTEQAEALKKQVEVLTEQQQKLDAQLKAQRPVLEGQRTVLNVIANKTPEEYKNALSTANREAAANNREAPLAKALAKVIVPKAKAKTVPGEKTASGKPVYDFQLWLDVPQDRKSEIRSVEYFFDHPTFLNKHFTSSDSSNGFAVNYRGWGALRLVVVTVNLREGAPLTLYFDMLKALKEKGTA